jgi:hypothetical protein
MALIATYADAWAAYMCARFGHVWSWCSYHTNPVAPPVGARCTRCGAIITKAR